MKTLPNSFTFSLGKYNFWDQLHFFLGGKRFLSSYPNFALLLHYSEMQCVFSGFWNIRHLNQYSHFMIVLYKWVTLSGMIHIQEFIYLSFPPPSLAKLSPISFRLWTMPVLRVQSPSEISEQVQFICAFACSQLANNSGFSAQFYQCMWFENFPCSVKIQLDIRINENRY